MKKMPQLRENKAIAELKRAFDDVSLQPNTIRRMQVGFWDRVSRDEGKRQRRRVLAWAGLTVFAAVCFVTIGLPLTVGWQDNGGKTVLPDTHVSPDKYIAVVSTLEGGATVREHRTNKPVTLKTTIEEGERIITGKKRKDKMELAVGPHRVWIDSGTEISFQKLEKHRLGFDLHEGKIDLHVSKLPIGGSLQVVSGDVTVRVMGTQFSVEKRRECIAVAVSEGIVEVRHADNRHMLHANDEKRICKTNALEPSEEDNRPTSSIDRLVSVKEQQIRKKKHLEETMSMPRQNRKQPESDATSPTPEEALFMSAKAHLHRGEMNNANAEFERYLESYPRGIFAEDAHFHLIKTAYRIADYDFVLTYGERFIDNYQHVSLPRLAQVRILCGEIWISKKRAPGKAWRLISPLIDDMDQLSPQLEKQLVSLLLQSACRSNMKASCSKWADTYLDRYPDGALSEMAEERAE